MDAATKLVLRTLVSVLHEGGALWRINIDEFASRLAQSSESLKSEEAEQVRELALDIKSDVEARTKANPERLHE